MRRQFEEQMEKLHMELIRMGALCEEAISAASEALLGGEAGSAESIAEADRGPRHQRGGVGGVLFDGGASVQ